MRSRTDRTRSFAGVVIILLGVNSGEPGPINRGEGFQMSTYEIVQKAILKKHQVIAIHKGYHRKMCPHMIGRKDGDERALFYQFGGRSTQRIDPDGSPRNWRCIRLAELSNIVIRPGRWHTAPNPSQYKGWVGEIDAQVLS